MHLWNPAGPEPETIEEVMHRHKDIQYSSRVAGHITKQMHTHRLRHVIKQLAAHVPQTVRRTEAVKELESWGCLTRMHVVRLIAPMVECENQSEDVDFSKEGIRQRWDAGLADAGLALERAAWQGEFDALEGVILHE